jgi:histidine decarboxylase|tara:strand:- start:536 stop:706 length:171 start_codon:yes stop_codon:yes gene_type:complete
MYKWGLATEGNITHIICIPSISKEQIDDFIIDLLEEKILIFLRLKINFLNYGFKYL